jgi:4-aminobutyrate aminotransferase/(S)-3-amino-2-methylpropionate transaminase
VPKLSVLGFEGGYHGKFMNSLSVSDYDNDVNSIKYGVAKQDWPIAPFPQIKFPYEDNYTHNRNEENRCVEAAEKIIKENYNNQPVAAMIIEPIQLLSGVRYASSQFYNDLIDVCYRNNVTFICDETQTGGWASGRPFMHTNWNADVRFLYAKPV